LEAGAGIIGEAEFRRQIQYIADEGWNVVSTTQIVDWITGGTTRQEKVVALHFDNGWLDTAMVASPILREFGITAACFPITDGVEAASESRSIPVRTLTEGVIEKPFMTWDQAHELLEAGWEIGAHTATHCRVAETHAAEGDEGVVGEIETSNDLFKRRLGLVPDHFAYPSGSRNDRTDTLLSHYYRSLRLWHFEWPIRWTFTDTNTSHLALECQNVDLRVPFEDFKRIFSEALAA
jgi:peptidoglycan/xylan/chitin deacetylase (PgdA/CDA1 family)